MSRGGGVLLRVAVTACFAAAGCAPSRPPAGPSPAELADLAASLSGMLWPLPLTGPGPVTSGYGKRGRRHHDGVDIDGRTGDPVFAARDGRVLFSGWRNGYGNTVVLDHGRGVTTLYGHASELRVRVGERVERGQPIAMVGATGNARGDHLHFEIAWAGRVIDPVPLLPELRAARRRGR